MHHNAPYTFEKSYFFCKPDIYIDAYVDTCGGFAKKKGWIFNECTIVAFLICKFDVCVNICSSFVEKICFDIVPIAPKVTEICS